MVLIAAGQLCSGASLTANINLVTQLLRLAASRQARILFLPEATDYIAPSPLSSTLARSVQDSELIASIRSTLSDLLQQGTPLDVSIGIHTPGQNGKITNTLVYVNSSGAVISSYDKLHLFDVTVAPDAPIVQESLVVQKGNSLPGVFDTPAGRLGEAICYDIRFPEHALNLRTAGAELLQFPSAFTTRTGAAHWLSLGRARAIDTQCYVIMAAQSGGHDPRTDEEVANGVVIEPKRFSYGHTMIIDPWGTVIGEVGDMDPQGLGIVVADIDLSLLKKVRQQMPLWEQRRTDVWRPSALIQ